ncbi:MAG: hypothetical protein WDW38_001730 [Sanguina aurantia]
MRGHRGCVNHISFNDSGSLLVSGSDDTTVRVWDISQDMNPRVKASFSTKHVANIFCTRFMHHSGDSLVASCAQDGDVRLTDLVRGTVQLLTHHHAPAKKLVLDETNPKSILSGSGDGTVRHVDVRVKHKREVVVNLRAEKASMQINSIHSPRFRPWLLAVGASDDLLRVYDRRMAPCTTCRERHAEAGASLLHHCGGDVAVNSAATVNCSCPFQVASFSPRGPASPFLSEEITGVCFSADGGSVLANYLGEYVYSFDMNRSSGTTFQKLDSRDGGSTRNGTPKRLRSHKELSPAETSTSPTTGRTSKAATDLSVLAAAASGAEGRSAAAVSAARASNAAEAAANAATTAAAGSRAAGHAAAAAAATVAAATAAAATVLEASGDVVWNGTGPVTCGFEPPAAMLHSLQRLPCRTNFLLGSSPPAALAGVEGSTATGMVPSQASQPPERRPMQQPGGLRRLGLRSKDPQQQQQQQQEAEQQDMRQQQQQHSLPMLTRGIAAMGTALPLTAGGRKSKKKEAKASGSARPALHPLRGASADNSAVAGRRRDAEGGTGAASSSWGGSWQGASSEHRDLTGWESDGSLSSDMESLNSPGREYQGAAEGVNPAEVLSPALHDDVREEEEEEHPHAVIAVPPTHSALPRLSSSMPDDGSDSGDGTSGSGSDGGPETEAQAQRRRDASRGRAADVSTERTAGRARRGLVVFDDEGEAGGEEGERERGSDDSEGEESESVESEGEESEGEESEEAGGMGTGTEDTDEEDEFASASDDYISTQYDGAGPTPVWLRVGGRPCSAGADPRCRVYDCGASGNCSSEDDVQAAGEAAGVSGDSDPLRTASHSLSALPSSSQAGTVGARTSPPGVCKPLQPRRSYLARLLAVPVSPALMSCAHGSTLAPGPLPPPQTRAPSVHPHTATLDHRTHKRSQQTSAPALLLAGRDSECEDVATRSLPTDAAMQKLGANMMSGGRNGRASQQLDAGAAAHPRAAPPRHTGFGSGSGSGSRQVLIQREERRRGWVVRFRGHCNTRTVKDVAFVGPDEGLVAAGSDDGRMMLWDRTTGRLVTALRADRDIVNCVASHPCLPMLASCGIDSSIKLFTPCRRRPRKLEGSRELRKSLAMNEMQRFFQAMHHQRIPEAAFGSARMREVLQMRVQATSN